MILCPVSSICRREYRKMQSPDPLIAAWQHSGHPDLEKISYMRFRHHQEEEN